MSKQFSRLELLFKKGNISELTGSTVVVLGLGGVGSYTVEALARSAIGRLVLVDRDVVDITNINRQLHAFVDNVGEYKVDLMKERIKRINPECEVIALPIFFDENSTELIFQHNPDYIVDAIDTINSKINIIVESKKRNIPIISSMGTANKLDPTQLMITDISKTHMDPVAKLIRKGLKKYGIEKGVSVVFSPEKPIKPLINFNNENDEGKLHNEIISLGSNAFVPPVAGLIMASEVVRRLCEVSE